MMNFTIFSSKLSQEFSVEFGKVCRKVGEGEEEEEEEGLKRFRQRVAESKLNHFGSSSGSGSTFVLFWKYSMSWVVQMRLYSL